MTIIQFMTISYPTMNGEDIYAQVTEEDENKIVSNQTRGKLDVTAHFQCQNYLITDAIVSKTDFKKTNFIFKVHVKI